MCCFRSGCCTDHSTATTPMAARGSAPTSAGTQQTAVRRAHANVSRKRLTQTSHVDVSRKRLMPIDYQQPMINDSIVCLLSRACLGKSSQKVNILSPSLRRSTLCMMMQQEVLTIVTKERTQAVRKPPLLLLRRFRMESNQSVAKTGSGQTQETLADKSARFLHLQGRVVEDMVSSTAPGP